MARRGQDTENEDEDDLFEIDMEEFDPTQGLPERGNCLR